MNILSYKFIVLSIVNGSTFVDTETDISFLGTEFLCRTTLSTLLICVCSISHHSQNQTDKAVPAPTSLTTESTAADAAAVAVAVDAAAADGRRPWYDYVTVEPTMFLYMLAFMLTSVVEQAFFLHKACRVNHGLSVEQCATLDANETLKRTVQVTVSNFHQWNNIASHVVPIVLALFLGAWSDKRGRKLPLLCGLVGKLVYSLMVVVNATQRECDGVWWVSGFGGT